MRDFFANCIHASLHRFQLAGFGARIFAAVQQQGRRLQRLERRDEAREAHKYYQELQRRSVRDENRVEIYDTRTFEKLGELSAETPSGIFFTARAHKSGL